MNSKKEETEEERAERFRLKQEWKNQPGNRYLPGEKTPLDDFELCTQPETAGLELDWA
jgi:hypothetical protein